VQVTVTPVELAVTCGVVNGSSAPKARVPPETEHVATILAVTDRFALPAAIADPDMATIAAAAAIVISLFIFFPPVMLFVL
jgi:hypothetical protein